MGIFNNGDFTGSKVFSVDGLSAKKFVDALSGQGNQ